MKTSGPEEVSQELLTELGLDGILLSLVLELSSPIYGRKNSSSRGLYHPDFCGT